MWVITLHGSPISPTFTHVLMHGESYKVGKGDDCTIKLSGARVKALEGVLQAEGWPGDGPADGKTDLTWRPAPDPRTGKITVNKLKLQRPVSGDESFETLTTPDFAIEELEQGFEMVEPGDGVKFAGENWFCSNWQPLRLVSEQMKDIDVEVQKLLRSFAIPLLADFSLKHPPTHVLSPTLRVNKACIFAVTQGLMILKPEWVEDLKDRLSNNWKVNAAGSDSFCLPDVRAEAYKPVMDDAMPQDRRAPELWIPNPKRKEIFKGYSVVAVTPGKIAPDNKYLQAMGAVVTPIQAAQTPAITAQSFTNCLRIVQEQHLQAGLEPGKLWMICFQGVQKKVDNWAEVFAAPATSLGFGIMTAPRMWRAVAAVDLNAIYGQETTGPVVAKTILSNSAQTTPAPAPAPTPTQPTASVVEEVAEEPELPEVPSLSRQTANAVAGPSTQQAREEGPPSSEKDAAKSPVKKALRRRMPTVKKDLLDDLDLAPLPSAQVPVPRRPSPVKDSIPDSVPTTQLTAGKLRRREAQKSLADDLSFSDFHMDSLSQKGMSETQVKLARHQALYEQPRGNSQAYRRVISEAIGEELEGDDMDVDDQPVTQPTPAQSQSQIQSQGQSQPSWITGETDFVQRSINKNNQERARREKLARDEAEEIEEVERRKNSPVRRSPGEMRPPPVPSTKSGPSKPARPAKKKANEPSQPSKDENFLQAVKTAAKGKKALDQFDKEFNQLRIVKPGAAAGRVVNQTEYDAGRPDYGIVKDFDHSTTGNFIVIERMNLFRKDSRPAPAPAVGGPNFKKFKKKNIARADPVPMKLSVAPAQTFGIGDAYWHEELSQTKLKGAFPPPRETQDSDMIDETQQRPAARGKAARKKREIHDSDEESLGDKPAAKRPRTRTVASTAASTSTRSRRSTTAETRRATVEPSASPPPMAQPSRSRSRAKAKTAQIIIEDSEDDTPPVPTLMPASSTLESSIPPSTLDASAAVGAASSSGRRKRLAPVDEDTSGLVFGSGAALKRRRRV